MEDVDDLALTGAIVYQSPEEKLDDGVVLVRRGRIANVGHRGAVEIPAGTRAIDCNGCAITPGFWNSHVHFHERKWADAESIPASELERELGEITQYGFTDLFDLSSPWNNTQRLRDRIVSGEIAGPRIKSTGEGLVPLGGSPSPEVFRALGLMETMLTEVSTVEQARDAAKKLLARGVDALKIFASSPLAGQLSREAIGAAADEAHLEGKLVFAHPNTAFDISAALAGGVDIIAHTTPRSSPWSEDILERMRTAGVALIPTLTVWKSMMRHDRISARDHAVTAAVGELRAWLKTGGEVLFGTDAGAMEWDPTDEYRLMADAGMSAAQILNSLTIAPAQRFSKEAMAGRIAAGSPATLVVLRGDPSTNVSALADVRYTMRDGKIIYGG
ncbi:MAG: amidohydrolase family protein [Candidatus Eremiobacteraeota bacterium]|nr:amidohydrolase family protein [Candidatus Eremiobacteraeota bacterium]